MVYIVQIINTLILVMMPILLFCFIKTFIKMAKTLENINKMVTELSNFMINEKDKNK